jgi:membrane associated rhomboid family serine protease
MPEGDRWYIQLLDRLGVNTTKLRWRIYQKEQQAKRLIESGGRPASLSWWSYPNKICPHCRAINNADLTICSSCGRRLPTMVGYRIRRLITTALPADAAVISVGFLSVMVLMWAMQTIMDGLGMASLMRPSRLATQALGSFTTLYGVEQGEYWRFLGFGLVHGGLLHIGMNCYFLVQIGPQLESVLSRARMLTLITVSQIAAGLVCYVWYGRVQGLWTMPVVGASGWLFGLLGFGIVYAHQHGVMSMRDSLLRSALFMFLLGFVVNSYASAGGISNAAHFGGMLGGFLTGAFPESNRNNPRAATRAWNAAGWVCLLLWIATLVCVGISVVRYWPQIGIES